MDGQATGEDAGMDETLVCFCTCPSPAVAETLAVGLVETGLAACVNLLPGVRSIYRWQGKVEAADEVMLWAKTSRRHYPALERQLRAAHPYELPEIIAVSITTGSDAYLQWIKDSLA
jgi:periplasmic divalent cation tolerance protein